MRGTRRKPEPNGLGRLDNEHPIFDGVAVPVARDRANDCADADAIAIAIADAHTGDTEPDDRAAFILAGNHDDRSRVLPAARWQRRRGRQ